MPALTLVSLLERLLVLETSIVYGSALDYGYEEYRFNIFPCQPLYVTNLNPAYFSSSAIYFCVELIACNIVML
jgi:hypothetical protein